MKFLIAQYGNIAHRCTAMVGVYLVGWETRGQNIFLPFILFLQRAEIFHSLKNKFALVIVISVLVMDWGTTVLLNLCSFEDIFLTVISRLAC